MQKSVQIRGATTPVFSLGVQRSLTAFKEGAALVQSLHSPVFCQPPRLPFHSEAALPVTVLTRAVLCRQHSFTVNVSPVRIRLVVNEIRILCSRT